MLAGILLGTAALLFLAALGFHPVLATLAGMVVGVGVAASAPSRRR